MYLSWGTWIAQSVEGPTVDVGSCHDLLVREMKPHIQLHADSKHAWD